MKSYKGFIIESGTVKNKNGFNVAPDANGYYSLPPNERLTIEQLQAKIDAIGGRPIVEQLAPLIEQEEIVRNQIRQALKSDTPKRRSPQTVTPKTSETVIPTESVTPKGVRTGIDNPKHKGIWIIEGNRYNSLDEAKDATGLRRNTILKMCLLGCSFEPK